MSTITIGRVGVKTTGKSAGKYCVITNIIDESFIEVTGPKSLSGIKRGRCNVNHFEPISKVIDIKQKADDEQVKEAIEKAKLTDLIKGKVKFG